MNKNKGLFAIIGVLGVVILAGGFWYQQERQKHSMEVAVGPTGVSIETK